jgi:hypothetical protein
MLSWILRKPEGTFARRHPSQVMKLWWRQERAGFTVEMVRYKGVLFTKEQLDFLYRYWFDTKGPQSMWKRSVQFKEMDGLDWAAMSYWEAVRNFEYTFFRFVGRGEMFCYKFDDEVNRPADPDWQSDAGVVQPIEWEISAEAKSWEWQFKPGVVQLREAVKFGAELKRVEVFGRKLRAVELRKLGEFLRSDGFEAVRTLGEKDVIELVQHDVLGGEGVAA